MIVFVRSYLWSFDGRIIKYFASLKKAKIDYFFIGWSRVGKYEYVQKHEIIYNKKASLGGGWRNAVNIILWNFFIFYSLFKIRKKIEIVHAVDLDTSISSYCFCRLFRKKLIFDVYDKYTAVRDIHGPLGEIINFIETYIVKKADLTLLVDEARLEQMKISKLQNNYLILENVPINPFKKFIELPEYNGIWRIGYFGVLEPVHRGIEDLLELALTRDDIEFHIVGYGGLEESIKKIVSEHDNIRYHGAMPSEAGLKHMAEMHILAGLYYLSIPNHAYAAPNKYYEHLLLGRGLLTTKNTAPGRKVELFSTGWAVEQGKLALDLWAEHLKIDTVQSCSKAASKLWKTHYANYYNENYKQKYIDQVREMLKKWPNTMITIIMPARNAEKTISKAIYSVINQTFKDWQLIVVDDQSTDSTACLINGFAKLDSRIKVLCQTEWSGVAVARNHALQHAKTQFVAFLDSDDYWEPDKLMLQISFLLKSKTPITYSMYRRVNNNGEQVGLVKPPSELTYHQLLRSNFIGNLTAVFDRNKLPELWFKKVRNEDYVFWLEALNKLNVPILATPSNKPLANYRVSKTSLSSNKFRAVYWQWKTYRRTLKLGIFKSITYMIAYSYYSILKRCKQN